MAVKVPFHIISKSLEDNPVLALLKQKGHFDFDDARNIVEVDCEAQYLIPKALSNDPLIKLLVKHKLFDFENENNKVFLPVDPQAAKLLGVSPFGNPPLKSYTDVVAGILEQLRGTRAFFFARWGGRASLAQMDAEVKHLQKKMGEALKSRQLFAAPLILD